MLIARTLNRFRFSTISHIRGRPENKADDDVELRGIHIKSTSYDSPNLIFIPEAFDQAENWLQFFTNPNNKILSQRNVWIIYPRNFGNSDRNPEMSWQTHANDVLRFMYKNRISMATLGGHGLGGKIALATACYHFDKVTGYFGIDSVPYDQYFFEPFHQLRNDVRSLRDIALNRPFSSISFDIKNKIKCPKWRSIFQSNLVKGQGSYTWKFNLDAIWDNIKGQTPNSLIGWSKSVGLYPGRVCFAFPDNSRYVYLNSNTLPMLWSCPHAKGFNKDIFSIQGDEGVQNHWVYDLDDEVNPYASKISHFLNHYDGVHVLLNSRQEVGKAYVPDRQDAREPRPTPSQVSPAHYYHNWRFNNVYGEQKKH